MKRALLVLVAALALTLVPLGSAETSYTDPAGDSGSGPDITTVTVSNTEAGAVTVRIATPLKPWDIVVVAINTDRNSATGDEWGLDRFIVAGMGPLIGGEPSPLDAWVEDESGEELPAVSLSATYAEGTIEFSFQKEAFSIDQGFTFGIASGSLYESDVFTDIAPDYGFWSYELTAPAPPPPPPAVKPMIGKPVARTAPIAGKKFTASFPITSSVDGKPLKTGTAECKTTVAGKTVRHTHTFKGGTLKATVMVPKAAKGKKLKIAVKVTADKTATKVFTFKIK